MFISVINKGQYVSLEFSIPNYETFLGTQTLFKNSQKKHLLLCIFCLFEMFTSKIRHEDFLRSFVCNAQIAPPGF